MNKAQISVEMKRSGAEDCQPEMEKETRKISNGKELLSAVKQSNLNEVNRLIHEEVDISCVDEEGNTVLHCAVLNSNAEIVQCILKYETVGDIIHVVNKDGATALGIANQLNKEDIAEKIENKILNDSFEVFKSLMEKAVTNTVVESNSQVKPDTKDKIKRKVEICLQALTELTKNEKDIKKFTYKNANVLLFFVETFALEDLNQEQDEKDTFINGYIRKEDNDRVKSIRANLIHRKDEGIIEPRYLQNFVVKRRNEDLTKFFRSLQKYTQAVYDKWNKGPSDSNEQKLTKVLQLNSNPQKKDKTKEQVFKLFRKLVIEAYTKEQKTEKAEELVFNLIVNIIPLIGDDLKIKVREIQDLRNDLIHNFHQYKNLNSRMLKIKETIFNVRSKAFHYYISEEIYNELSTILLDATRENIEDTLNKKLDDFQKDIQKKKVDIFKESEVEQSYEYVFSQPLFQKKDQDVETSVGEYLKFMIITDDEKRDDQIDDENQIDDAERSKTSVQYKELNDAERREIFEDFIRLKKLRTSSENLYQVKESQVELKRKLGEYGIREDHFDMVIKLYIEADNIPDKQAVNKVAQIIKSLQSLINSHTLKEYRISSQDIASLYKRFTEKKGVFCLDNHKDLLKNYGLIESAKAFINTNLNNLPENEILDISLGGKEIKISTFKVVNNILQTFYNAYHKYQTKFNEIKELFKNEIFLDYLVSLDIRKRWGNVEFKDKKHVYIIIKKLLKLEYTAPYIASLLTKGESDEVIDTDDYIKLIEILLKEDSYITYLNKLLNVNSKTKPNFNLYEIVYNRILETDNFNIESLHVILDDPKHANESLNVLGTKIDTLKPIPEKLLSMIKEVLELLNNIALKLIYKGKYEEALKILSDEIKVDQLIYTKLINKELIKSDDSIIIERKLNIAKAKAAQGTENKINKENNKFEEALKVLEEIPDTNHPLFFLSLSRKAFIYNLLEEYDKACEQYGIVYEKIMKFVLGSNVGTTSITKEIYTKIKKSEEYQYLLASSNDCKRYLNIVTIKRGIAYCKLMQGQLNGALVDYEEALKLYNEIYNMNREDSEKEYENNSPTLRQIAFISYSIGKLLFNSKEYLDALEHYYTGLAVDNRILECARKMYGDYYQNTKKAIKYTIKMLNTIAHVYTEFGSSKTLGNNRAQKYNEALKINQQIYQFESSNIFEENERVVECLRHIALIHYKLSYLKSSTDLEEALIHCNELIQANEKIIRIQKNRFGENVNLLLETEEHLKRAESWKEKLLNK